MDRYWVGSGTNWNSTASWSATDGGASGASVPISSDNVFFTALSGNAIITASSVCNNLDCTGYSGSWSGTGTLSPSGLSIIMSGAMSSTWTGSFTPLNASVSITSNGFLSSGLTIAKAGQTINLVDALNVSSYTHTGAGATNTINGANLIWRGTGQFTMSAGRVLTGTSLVVLAPTTTGSISITGAISNNVSVNAPGAITQIGSITISGGTWTYTAGTWNPGTSAISITGNVSLDLAGMPVYRVLTGAAGTLTLLSHLTMLADIQYSLASGFILAGASGFTCQSITHNASSTGRQITLSAGAEYFVTSSLLLVSGAAVSKPIVKSGTPGTKAKLTLSHGVTIDSAYCDFTDIDASNGDPIFTYNGIVTNCDNIMQLPHKLESNGYVM